MPEKTPQDRKPKADEGHKFTVKGKTYTLPAIGETAGAEIPGEITYDAIMRPDDNMAQMRLAFATLEAAKPTEAAMKALRSMSTEDMLTTVGEWMGGSEGSSE